MKETFTQKWNKDYDIATSSDTQEHSRKRSYREASGGYYQVENDILKLFEEEQVNSQNMEYLGRLIDFSEK